MRLNSVQAVRPLARLFHAERMCVCRSAGVAAPVVVRGLLTNDEPFLEGCPGVAETLTVRLELETTEWCRRIGAGSRRPDQADDRRDQRNDMWFAHDEIHRILASFLPTLLAISLPLRPWPRNEAQRSRCH